jgi:hypothetical protein
MLINNIGVQSQSNEPKRALDCKKNSQNLINIYVFPFKAMEIMASYCLFITKNPFDEIISFKF